MSAQADSSAPLDPKPEGSGGGGRLVPISPSTAERGLLTQLGLPLMGLPGLTVSTGLVGHTPVGVHLLAGRFREDLLFAAGAAIEAAGAPHTPVDPA